MLLGPPTPLTNPLLHPTHRTCGMEERQARPHTHTERETHTLTARRWGVLASPVARWSTRGSRWWGWRWWEWGRSFGNTSGFFYSPLLLFVRVSKFQKRWNLSGPIVPLERLLNPLNQMLSSCFLFLYKFGSVLNWLKCFFCLWDSLKYLHLSCQKVVCQNVIPPTQEQV